MVSLLVILIFFFPEARRNAKAVVSACPLASLPPDESTWRSQHAEDDVDDDMPPAKRSRGPDKA
jgi:hypothetical protein